MPIFTIIAYTLSNNLHLRPLAIHIVSYHGLASMGALLFSSTCTAVAISLVTAMGTSAPLLFLFLFCLYSFVHCQFLFVPGSQYIFYDLACVGMEAYFTTCLTPLVIAFSTTACPLFAVQSFKGHSHQLLLEVEYGICMRDINLCGFGLVTQFLNQSLGCFCVTLKIQLVWVMKELIGD